MNHKINYVAAVFADTRIRGGDDPEKRGHYHKNRGFSYKTLALIFGIMLVALGLVSMSTVQTIPLYERVEMVSRNADLAQEMQKLRTSFDSHLTQEMHGSDAHILDLTAQIQLMNQKISALQHTVFKDRTEAIGSLNAQLEALRQAISGWRLEQKTQKEPAAQP